MDSSESYEIDREARGASESGWRCANTWIRENPLAAAGFSAAAGFILGGGARTRLAGTALLLTARMVFAEAISGAVASAIRNPDAAHNGRIRL